MAPLALSLFNTLRTTMGPGGLARRLLLVFAALALLHLALYRQRRRSNAKMMPGALPIVGHLVFILSNYDRLLEVMLDAFRKSKVTSLQIWMPFLPGTVLSVDPRTVEHYLSQNFANYEKGPLFRGILHDLLGDGIFTSDGAHWKVQRKVASQIFTTKNFRDFFTDVFLEEAHILTRRLEKASQSGEVLDLHDYFHRLTLDSFGRLAFGVNLRCLENEEQPAFANAFDGLQNICDIRFSIPGWELVERINGVGALASHYKKIIDDFALNIIRERRRNPQNQDLTKADLIVRFMNTKDEDGKSPSDLELRDIVVNFIIAGRDTTALTLSWTMFELFRNPQVLARVVAEIDAATPLDTEINFDVIKKLTYTHCCVTETLRLYPAVPKNSKVALTDDVLPDGTTIPKDTFTGHMPWVMGRLTDIWGPDAEQYRPERWLSTIGKEGEIDITPGTVYQAKVNQFKFPAFHAGPRLCLGQSMAYLEAVAVLACVLRKFRIDVLNPEKVTYLQGLVLRMKEGLKVRVLPRADV